MLFLTLNQQCQSTKGKTDNHHKKKKKILQKQQGAPCLLLYLQLLWIKPLLKLELKRFYQT